MLDLTNLSPDDDLFQLAGCRFPHQVIAHWAGLTPLAPALIDAGTGRSLSWRNFDRYLLALAIRFMRLGLVKGDRVVTLLPLSVDHAAIVYACLRIGVVVLPLPLELDEPQLRAAIERFQPRACFGLGVQKDLDFRPLWEHVRQSALAAPLLVTVGSDLPVEGASAFGGIHYEAWRAAMTCASMTLRDDNLGENDAALAWLSAAAAPATLSQLALVEHDRSRSTAWFANATGLRTLVPRAASDPAAQLQLLMTTLFAGGTAVLVDSAERVSFDAARALDAIARHKVEGLVLTPDFLEQLGSLPGYATLDRSRLKLAVCLDAVLPAPLEVQLQGLAPLVRALRNPAVTQTL